MAQIQMRLAMTNGVQYGNTLIIAKHGVISVPIFAVPELIAAGCELLEDVPGPINVLEELAAAEDHEISFYLHSHGVPPAQFMTWTPDEARTKALELERARK